MDSYGRTRIVFNDFKAHSLSTEVDSLGVNVVDMAYMGMRKQGRGTAIGEDPVHPPSHRQVHPMFCGYPSDGSKATVLAREGSYPIRLGSLARFTLQPS